jgi:hypothetical protein
MYHCATAVLYTVELPDKGYVIWPIVWGCRFAPPPPSSPKPIPIPPPLSFLLRASMKLKLRRRLYLAFCLWRWMLCFVESHTHCPSPPLLPNHPTSPHAPPHVTNARLNPGRPAWCHLPLPAGIWLGHSTVRGLNHIADCRLSNSGGEWTNFEPGLTASWQQTTQRD